jgi:hypothetical protein
MWSLRDPPVRLDQITKPISYSNPSLVIYHRGQTIAGVTVIEYAVATYGREHLPALVAGLGQSESWDTLLPAIFDVSAAEFEAGWQAYLTAHYGVIDR